MPDEERKQPGVAREYANERIAVTWEPEYCIHTARCLAGLPEVFDARRRPWIDITAADADAIAGIVQQCPTGALRYRRLDGDPQEAPSEAVIRPARNGPLFVRGPVQVLDSEGQVRRDAIRMALCRCGQSGNKPFCDGTHRVAGFEAD
jgi:uncharacterized Fe-S cluster protein YjdI